MNFRNDPFFREGFCCSARVPITAFQSVCNENNDPVPLEIYHKVPGRLLKRVCYRRFSLRFYPIDEFFHLFRIQWTDRYFKLCVFAVICPVPVDTESDRDTLPFGQVVDDLIESFLCNFDPGRLPELGPHTPGSVKNQLNVGGISFLGENRRPRKQNNHPQAQEKQHTSEKAETHHSDQPPCRSIIIFIVIVTLWMKINSQNSGSVKVNRPYNIVSISTKLKVP